MVLKSHCACDGRLETNRNNPKIIVPVISFFPLAFEDIIFIPLRYFLLSNDNDLSGNYQQREVVPQGNLMHKKSNDLACDVKHCLLGSLRSRRTLREILSFLVSQRTRSYAKISLLIPCIHLWKITLAFASFYGSDNKLCRGKSL